MLALTGPSGTHFERGVQTATVVREGLDREMTTRQEGSSEPRSRNPARCALVRGGLCALLLGLPVAVVPQEPAEPAVEQVELNGRLYKVPPPWRGNRITKAADPTALAKVPSDLTGEFGIYVTPGTRDAVVAMAAAAREQGIRLEVDSGFRSYGFQKRVLEGLLAGDRPFLNAVRWTAPPGYSEHITGRAVDFVPSDADFKDVPAYQWLKERAADFCFTESYPLGNAGGFEWEPWHWRYEECDE